MNRALRQSQRADAGQTLMGLISSDYKVRPYNLPQSDDVNPFSQQGPQAWPSQHLTGSRLSSNTFLHDQAALGFDFQVPQQ